MNWPALHVALPRDGRDLVASEVGALTFRDYGYGVVRAVLTLPCGCQFHGPSSHTRISAAVALVDTIDRLRLPGHEYQ